VKSFFKKVIILGLTIILVIPLIYFKSTTNAAASPASSAAIVIDPRVQAEMNDLQFDEMLTVIVTLKEQADLSRIPGASRAARQQGVIRALQAKAEASQKQIITYLTNQQAHGNVTEFDSFWVFNGLSATATLEVIETLADRSDVVQITSDEADIIPNALNAPQTNLIASNVPPLWELGFTGQGVVVANLDTGVDAGHPDLAGKWRAGGNSWYDPYNQHSTPYDSTGHGTQTMGVLVGEDAGGTNIGVAPGAQWIAAKIFNDSGSATSTAIHQSFQWLLDPDGNPSTPDAPFVVNNSWIYGFPGCNLEFQLDLQALRAMGILPVFAAGNYGPGSSTSVSPANYPEALAVGAVDNIDQIYALSGRGPSDCGESATIYPELVAPGVDIHTADYFTSYTTVSGTSLSAPHVSGGLALLLSAFPNTSAAQQEAALLNSAVDLGLPGPDDEFGNGRLDIFGAFQWLEANGSEPTPTPTPDPTINLALNQVVSVSSTQDSSYAGGMAVDGSIDTFWKTARAKGKNKLPSEWITVDLGSSVSIGKVILEWNANFATDYSIQISEDNSNWTIAAVESNGSGGSDTLTFTSTSARYVKMESTAWSSGSLRVWLNEFQVFAGDGSDPQPTPTPTPPPGGGTTIHIGDLDGLGSPKRKNWNATITILVHEGDENPLSEVTVSGTWSDGAFGSGSCVTDANGLCTISKNNLKSGVNSVTFTLDSLAHSSFQYQPGDNHDPDGNGTSIVVLKP
jgi:subtilisin family serine protease